MRYFYSTEKPERLIIQRTISETDTTTQSVESEEHIISHSSINLCKHTMNRLINFLLALVTIVASFIPSVNSFSLLLLPATRYKATHQFQTKLRSGAPSDTDQSYDIPASVGSASERVEDCKRDLIQQCDDHELGSGFSPTIEGKIKDLEQLGEDAGFGQASSLSGLISGEW